MKTTSRPHSARLRWLAPALLACLLVCPGSVLAQPEPEEGEKKSDDPVPSYLYFGFIAAGAIFVVCKSARR